MLHDQSVDNYQREVKRIIPGPVDNFSLDRESRRMYCLKLKGEIMESEFFVMVFRGSENRPWQTLGRPHRERRMVENAIEIERAKGDALQYGYIEGHVVIPRAAGAQIE